MHKHLQRLSRIVVPQPHYFLTICTHQRQAILADSGAHSILREEWDRAIDRHGWAVGRYVVMPDHVHFFCREVRPGSALSRWIQQWKQWTAKRIIREAGQSPPIWQPEFFDHLMRSDESFAEKWSYVSHNPVRAGLVGSSAEWPYQGAIHYDQDRS